MGMIIIAELIFLGVFKLWPTQVAPKSTTVWEYSDNEIFTEQMIPTRQLASPASPPRPQVPVPVPNDQVIEEDIEFIDFNDITSLEPLGEGEVGQMGDGNEIVGNPQRAPRLLKIVEPATPDAAQKAGIIAEVLVTFLVGKEGDVEDIYVSEIRRYSRRGGSYEIVQSIGYGLIEASLEAAKQWRFRPAINNGTEVRAYTTQVFSFGF